MHTNEVKTPINILLADDDRDDRFFFEKALKEMPLSNHLTTFENGEELMDYLSKTAITLPDIIFLDISMPRKTGIECLIEIKNDKRLEHIVVVIFTTSFTKGIELELKLSNSLFTMGAQDYIRKPAGFEELKQVLHQTILKITERARLKIEGGIKMDEAVNLKQIDVVLADDDIDDQHFFKKALALVPLSTKLTIVSDGQELMAYLSKNSEHLPHVLFLDINMPLKNGFECLKEIKENEKLKDLPVVMFSTSNSQDNISIFFKTGADVYVRKPANFMELVQVIHHALPIATENIFSNGKLKYVFNP